MCSVGLEGWKIVSRFNYILFRFSRPVGRAISHSNRRPLQRRLFLPSRVFYVFPPFQFPLEWKSLEHYCNFPSTANGIGFPSPTAACRPRNSHLYKMDGFFSVEFFSFSCEMDAGNCCCRGIYGEAMTVCMCSEAGIAKESTGWQWAEKERIKVWDHVTRVE